MSKRGSAVVLLIAWYLSGAIVPAGEQKKSKVITKTGQYTLFDGKVILKVSDAEGKLTASTTHTLKNNNTLTAGTSLPSNKGAFWLVYPETPNKLWLFREPDLMRTEWKETKQGPITYTTAFGGQNVLKVAPKALLDALPQEVLDKLKGK
jgi:hypothetical protein